MPALRAPRGLLFPALALLLAAPVWAQRGGDAGGDDGKDKIAERAVEEITVRGTARHWREAGSLSALGDVLDGRISHHASQVFGAAPGVWVSRGSGQEHLTGIRSGVLTGPGACGNFALLEDGVPIRPPGFCNVNGLLELDLLGAEAVHVIRGPNTSLTGANAAQGAINVIPPQPGAATQVRVTASEWSRATARARFGLGTQEEGFLADLLVTSDGGWRENSSVDEQKFRFVNRWGRGWKFLLTATNLDQETAGYIKGLDAYKDDALRFTNPDPDAARQASSLRLLLSKEGKRESWKFFARNTSMDFVQHFLPGTPTESNGHTGLGFRWQSLLQREFGGFVILVLEGELGTSELQQTQEEADSDGCMVGTGSSPCFPQGPHYDYEVDYGTAGLLLQYQWKLGDYTLYGDWRYAAHLYDYRNNLSAGSACPGIVPLEDCRYTRPGSDQEDYDENGWRFALRRPLTRRMYHYLGVSGAQRPPQMAELYRLQRGQTLASLLPVSVRQAEYGLGWDWKRGKLSFAAYSLTRRNDIVTADNQISNQGLVRGVGLEMDASGSIGNSVFFQAAATLARHEYDRAFGNIARGNQVDTAPNTRLWTRWAWEPSPILGLSVEGEYMGSYFTDAENQHSYDGHTLVHLRAYGEVGASLRWSVQLDNATDQAYADRADYSRFGGGDRYFPGRPQALSISLTWKAGE